VAISEGLERIDGVMVDTPSSLVFQAPCDEDQDALCEDIDPLPEATLTGSMAPYTTDDIEAPAPDDSADETDLNEVIDTTESGCGAGPTNLSLWPWLSLAFLLLWKRRSPSHL
jgi:hypothetical protein